MKNRAKGAKLLVNAKIKDQGERPTFNPRHFPKLSQENQLTIRQQARGFYWVIVGEGQSLEPTIKGDRKRERAV